MKREENQDAYGLAQTDSASLFIVADGMGGAAGGATASFLAVNIVPRIAVNQSGGFSPDTFFESIRIANEYIHNQSVTVSELHGMGTTLVMLGIIGNRALLANVGDSRIYFFRGGNFSQLTKDHTLIRELVESGEIAPEHAENHPVAHMLTRALGGAPVVEPDVEFLEYPVQEGDRFLLCCDGLYNHLGDDEIGSMVASYQPEEAVEKLVQLANSRGGTDNITVQILEVQKAKKETVEALPSEGVIELSYSEGDFKFEDSNFSHALNEKLVDLYDQYTSELIVEQGTKTIPGNELSSAPMGSVLSGGQETFDNIILGLQEEAPSEPALAEEPEKIEQQPDKENETDSSISSLQSEEKIEVVADTEKTEAEPVSGEAEKVAESKEVVETEAKLSAESEPAPAPEQDVKVEAAEEKDAATVEEEKVEDPPEVSKLSEEEISGEEVEEKPVEDETVSEDRKGVNFVLQEEDSEEGNLEAESAEPVESPNIEEEADSLDLEVEADSLDIDEELVDPLPSTVGGSSPKKAISAASLLLLGLTGAWFLRPGDEETGLTKVQELSPVEEVKVATIQAPEAGNLSLDEERERLVQEARAIAEEKIRLDEEREEFEASKKAQELAASQDKEKAPAVSKDQAELIERQQKVAAEEEASRIREPLLKNPLPDPGLETNVKTEVEAKDLKEPAKELVEEPVVAVDWEKESKLVEQAKKEAENESSQIETKETLPFVLTTAEQRKISLKKNRVRDKIASVEGKIGAARLKSVSEKKAWMEGLEQNLNVIDKGHDEATKNYRLASSELRKWREYQKLQGRSKPLSLAKKIASDEGSLKPVVRQIEQLSLEYSQAAEGDLSDPATANKMIKLGTEINERKKSIRTLSKKVIDKKLDESQANLVEYSRLKDELSRKKKVLNKQIGTTRTIKPGSRQTGAARLKELTAEKADLEEQLKELTRQLSNEQELVFKREQVLKTGR